MARLPNELLYSPCVCDSNQKLKFCCAALIMEAAVAGDERVADALALLNAGQANEGRVLLADAARSIDAADPDGDDNNDRWLRSASDAYPLPIAAEDDYVAGLEAVQDGDPRAAVRHFEAGLMQAPNHPTLRFNMITARLMFLMTGEEREPALLAGRAALRALLDEFPEYLFARAQLATMLVAAKLVGEAAAVLHPKHLESCSDDEWIAMAHLAIARIALAGDIDEPSRQRIVLFNIAAAADRGIDVAARAPDLAPFLIMTQPAKRRRAR